MIMWCEMELVAMITEMDEKMIAITHLQSILSFFFVATVSLIIADGVRHTKYTPKSQQ